MQGIRLLGEKEMPWINKDRLLVDVLNIGESNSSDINRLKVLSLIRNQPSHRNTVASWVNVRTEKKTTLIMQCSLCDFVTRMSVTDMRYNYCPYCGAKMKSK